MEYANHLNEYAPAWSEAQVAEEVARIREAAKRNHNAEVYKMCYSAIDITTLSCNDSVTSVTEFARKTAEFYQKFPHIPNVASICIYPAFVETVGLAVDGTPMKITSVGGGFPAAQTFLEVKALEVAMAIENGADEVDIVLNVGRMLTGEYDEAANEVEVIRSEMDADVVLKVIIEWGAQNTRSDPQGIAAFDVRRSRFRKDLDRKDRRGRNARSGRGHVSGDPRLLPEDGPQGGIQGRRRRSHGRGRRPLLYDRRGDSRPGMAQYGYVPHRRLFCREQPPFGYRRQGDQVLLIACKSYRGMQQSGFGLLLFVGLPADRETGCPEHSAGKPNGLPGNLFCRATGLPEKGRGLTISASLNRRHKLRKAATGRRRKDNREDNRKVSE